MGFWCRGMEGWEVKGGRIGWLESSIRAKMANQWQAEERYNLPNKYFHPICIREAKIPKPHHRNMHSKPRLTALLKHCVGVNSMILLLFYFLAVA